MKRAVMFCSRRCNEGWVAVGNREEEEEEEEVKLFISIENRGTKGTKLNFNACFNLCKFVFFPFFYHLHHVNSLYFLL